ncbi:hypothetical protein GOP47_0007193 [Adiantum capillus-veneris]|uniref:Uncharacterized protein n=1 Tax=Adiantum capillus-veneris TaxID=13818 RepID=A0A9D4V0F8_ADICA|nr:hypothetical protein GOP47_0007193 [Adiantum capillus-veneris]
MEVLVYEDTKEVEANFALEDDLSSVISKKKRRVSFAQTQTIHVIPRHDDMETPPLLNSDLLPSNSNAFSPASRVSAEQQSAAHEHPSHENSMDFSHFTSDMDTDNGSWTDDDFPAHCDSADGSEDESGCFVHLRHISQLEDDDSIVNEVFNDDMTMDATAFSRNLSHFLKSGTTFDLQEAGHSGEVAKITEDCDVLSEENSMALTKTGPPHRALINPQDVSIHADDDKSDMSLATGPDRTRPQKRGNLSTEHKLSVSNAAEHSLPGITGRSTHSFIKEKENLAPHNLQDGTPLSAEPRSQNKRLRVFEDKARISLEESKTKAKQISRDSLVEDRTPLRPLSIAKVALSEDTRSATTSRTFASVGQAGGTSFHPNLRATRSLEDILHHLKNASYIKVNQADEEFMVQPHPTKLHTLSDYLEFTCNTQPQVDWLSEHIQELEVKLLNAKKRNIEVMSCSLSAQFQKLSEESFYALKSKLASTQSLAKKRWILWRVNAQKQVFSLLRESKVNLMKEVEAAKMMDQKVRHLIEAYSQMVAMVELDKAKREAVDKFPAAKEAAQPFTLRQGEEKAGGAFSQSNELKDRHHLYQEACDQLSHLRSEWHKIQIKVQSVVSVHSQRLQSDKDEVSFENDLKASIRKLAFTNSLLQQQQVMHLKAKNSGRYSVIDLSLRGMYLLSFQFEGDNPSAKVQISKSLHPEEIEKAFPCVEAFLFFQYSSSDHCWGCMELQHLYRIIQRSNYISGCWMDVLKEIKFCRRNFGITCKFQVVNGNTLLSVTFLQCQNGISVRLMFDMACARGGGYPFDKNPADVQIQTYGLAESESSITRRDMVSRIGKIQRGLGRLARICSYVEQTMGCEIEHVLD